MDKMLAIMCIRDELVRKYEMEAEYAKIDEMYWNGLCPFLRRKIRIFWQDSVEKIRL